MVETHPALFEFFATDRLTWWEEIGIGHYPVKTGHAPYDAEYWERYQRQADTDIGRRLMGARERFVRRHWQGQTLIDVGIGSGAFIEARNGCTANSTFGYDVNPEAVNWLRSRSLYWNIHNGTRVPALSFWDVLEHIPDFPKIIANVTDMVFVSIPIFQDAAHVLRSKHYRKDEHVWYFTANGLVWLFDQLGFELVEQNYEEELIGREDIGSFAFRRKVV